MNDAERSVFAPLTAPGRGGIAVIRATGPHVADALAACFRPAGGPRLAAGLARRRPSETRPASRAANCGPPRETLPVGRLAYGHVLDGKGRVLDEVILHHAGPAMWEVNCHGGPAAVEAVCHRLASLGLVQVKVDALLVAEGAGSVERAARRLLHTVATPLAARILLDQFTPALRGAQPWAPRDEEVAREERGGSGDGMRGGSPYPSRDKAPDSQGAVGAPRLRSGQAPTDRTTRSCGALERAAAGVADALAAGRTEEAAAGLDTLLDRWRTCGRYLAEPPRVVIAGRPNVGKSTLLNRLAGRERAITHPEAGTTRDYVETVAAFEGLPVVLVDTAGLRDTGGQIEREGVARAREQTAGADLVLYLLDAAAGATAEDERLCAPYEPAAGAAVHSDPAWSSATADSDDRPLPRPARTAARAGPAPVLAVWNKADLASGALGPPAAPAVSARTGAGLDELRREVLMRLDYRAPPPGAAVPFTQRQEQGLRCAARLMADRRLEESARRLAALLSHG